MYRWFISYFYPISAFGDQQFFFSIFLGRNNFSESRSRNSGRTRHGRIDVDRCQGKSDKNKFFKIGICINKFLTFSNIFTNKPMDASVFPLFSLFQFSSFTVACFCIYMYFLPLSIACFRIYYSQFCLN